MPTSSEDVDSQSYPKLVIRLEGLPSQSRLEQLYGRHAFEYTLPLPEYIFDEAPLRKAPMRPFSRTKLTPPLESIQSCPKTKSQWRKIAISLHRWLQDNIVERETDEWLWTVNIYWISYTACNPLFPLGRQDGAINWDPRKVPMACEHIAQRVEGLDLRFRCKNQSWLIWNDWIELREVWCKNGVKTRDFEARIGKYL